jgi:UPF0755 protein
MQDEVISTARRKRSRLGLGCGLILLALVLGLGAAVYILYSQYNQWQQAVAASGLDMSSANPALNSLRRILLERYLVQRAEQLRQPAGTAAEPVLFVIESGATAAEVVQKLAAIGLVSDAELFLNYLIYYGLDAGLVAGQYTLDPQATVIEMADRISRINGQMVELSFLPGWRAEEIAHYLDVTTPAQISAEDFLDVVQRRHGIDFTNINLTSHDFLANLPPDASLEGYLFPEVYLVNGDADAEALVTMMLENFDRRVTPAMRQAFGVQGLSLHEAVTLASIVEREGVVHDERPLIAGVFLKRLQVGMPLQADATVQYAIGQPAVWWKVPLDAADLQANSPYNTYRVNGLPPSPIANPGLESLQAVANPTETDFLFFVVDCTAEQAGRHVFSVTYEEHLTHVQRCQ